MRKERATRRARIVAVARAFFVARGYEGTTIGDLAAELGISKAAIAYYFPTKERFLDELLAPFLDELDAAIGAAMSPRDATDAYLTVLERHLDVAVWLDTDASLQDHPDFGGRLARLNRRFARIITSASRSKAERVRALGVLGGIWRPVRELDLAELLAHHDEIVDAALATP